MAGSFDTQAFSTGDYVLAVGPSVEPGTIPDAIPAPTPGTKVTLNGQSYTVMAVVYPLNPVTAGASQQNAAGRFEMQFILPAGVTEGEWRVKITTQYTSGNKLTKEPRTYEMERPIVIGETTSGGGEEGGGGMG